VPFAPHYGNEVKQKYVSGTLDEHKQLPFTIFGEQEIAKIGWVGYFIPNEGK
jgi:hypothetical protein